MKKIVYNESEGSRGGVIDVVLPLSKSIAARALILDYIYGRGEREELPDCDDSRELNHALVELRKLIPSLPARMEKVRAGEEVETIQGDFNLGAGGTSLRFFLALAASIPGLEATIDCNAQLKRRPLTPLVDALRGVGADIECLEEEGRAPLKVKGRYLKGGKVDVAPGMSSQFASAILMASQLWMNPAMINVADIVSRPYFDMTLKMLQRKGDLPIERDWSAATFFYQMVLMNPGLKVRMKGLVAPQWSLQGDSLVAQLFERIGVLTAWEKDEALVYADKERMEHIRRSGNAEVFDMGTVPDAVPAMVVGMLFANIKFDITNIAHLAHKESDRISALQTEMKKFGFELQYEYGTLRWLGVTEKVNPDEVGVLDTYKDHRMVMVEAMIPTVFGKVEVLEVASVSKSFPTFFDEMKKFSVFIEND